MPLLSRQARSRLARRCILCLVLTLAQPAHATETVWVVNRPGDSAADGDLPTHSGTLRFALAHASSGDLVAFSDTGTDTLFVEPANGPLIVPDGVAVGGRRGQPCARYDAPAITIQDPAQSAAGALNPLIQLGAGATLRNIALLGGLNAIAISGAGAEVCGVGIGRTVGGDGDVITLPPWHAALIVDGERAIIRGNYIDGPIVVTTHGSDTRIGDAAGGSGEGNDGVRDAWVTVLADAGGAAQRVTIRDPFPRSLSGMPGAGVSGGDDDPTHANNWALTPTIISAYTPDGGASMQVRGIASPSALIDIYADTQVTIARQAPVLAGADGSFLFSGPVPPGTVSVVAASTLADPSHPGRVGSASQWSQASAIVSAPAEPLIEAVGHVVDLSGAPGGPAHVGDLLRFTITMTNAGTIDVGVMSTTNWHVTPGFSVVPGSGTIQGQGSGFVATDDGFSGGMLAPGQVASYSALVHIDAGGQRGTVVVGAEVNGEGIIAIPVVGRMAVAAPLPLTPRSWLPTIVEP